ncbi:MAG: MTAP family purine nucleoside phosphorylase [Syntrophomonadaceae bacterium]|nr:MTAP family purine nucleoside phosphorylase [Syntrophomonadaceae bacterium]
MPILPTDFAFIGGSSTLSINIPNDLQLDFVQVLDNNITFTTPFGNSPPFKRLLIQSETGNKTVLTCRMHGWRQGVTRDIASKQIFWVFKEAKVKKIIAEGGVGAINYLLDPRDVVIAHDYMDFSVRKDVGLDDKYLLIMREAICPEMSKSLFALFNNKWHRGKVFNRGIYVNTDGRHFESPAEIMAFKQMGGDIVGQSICPEVYLAREIGACYAGVYIVVNYAEGIVTPWQHAELSDIFYKESINLGKLMFEFIRNLPIDSSCQCNNLRKETLLKEVYEEE